MALSWDEIKLEFNQLDLTTFARQFLFLIFNLINIDQDLAIVTRLLEQSRDPESFVKDIISRCEINIQEANDKDKERYLFLIRCLLLAASSRNDAIVRDTIGVPFYGSYNSVSFFYCSLVGIMPTNIFGKFEKPKMRQLLARSNLFHKEENINAMTIWIRTYLPVAPPDELLPNLARQWPYNYERPSIQLSDYLHTFYQVHPLLREQKNDMRVVLGSACKLKLSDDKALFAWANSADGEGFFASLRKGVQISPIPSQFALDLAALLNFIRLRQTPSTGTLPRPINTTLGLSMLELFDKILQQGIYDTQLHSVLEILAVAVKKRLCERRASSPLSKMYHSLLERETKSQDYHIKHYVRKRFSYCGHDESLAACRQIAISRFTRKRNEMRQQQLLLPQQISQLPAADERYESQDQREWLLRHHNYGYEKVCSGCAKSHWLSNSSGRGEVIRAGSGPAAVKEEAATDKGLTMDEEPTAGKRPAEDEKTANQMILDNFLLAQRQQQPSSRDWQNWLQDYDNAMIDRYDGSKEEAAVIAAIRAEEDDGVETVIVHFSGPNINWDVRSSAQKASRLEKYAFYHSTSPIVMNSNDDGTKDVEEDDGNSQATEEISAEDRERGRISSERVEEKPLVYRVE